jgi:hypothetical protein
MRFLVALALIIVGLSAPAAAQDEPAEEIVVTASRYREAYENFTIPHVSYVRRADFAVQQVTIASDTREAQQRLGELRQALQSLTRYADRNARVSVALIEEDSEGGQARVVAFTVEKAMESLRPAGRPDTSAVTVSVRTRIAAGDDVDDVNARLAQFVGTIPRPGRVEVSSGGLQLTLNDPQQYRPQIITAIAADVAQISGSLGAGYGARLEGLESPIAWRRAGDLDLRLFIPYRMVILPREAI